MAQRTVYSGHKRAHGMNWQAIVTPNGLVSSLAGPFAGTNNDWSIWKRSGCEGNIRRVIGNQEMLYIYIGILLITPRTELLRHLSTLKVAVNFLQNNKLLIVLYQQLESL
jgi:hypothetical protein